MELAHEREGSGPPLVLLAGIGMNATAWQPLRSRLAAERELTLIDLPGFGDSAALPDHVWLRGCGHVPMSDDPDQVAAVILRGSADPVGRGAARDGADATGRDAARRDTAAGGAAQNAVLNASG